jgi:DNA repair protein RecO (recombination protein O)
VTGNKLIKTKGIVLSEANYSETDKILTILTYDLGKVSCIAKGARRNQSRFLASSQLFAFSDLILYKGNGELYHINSAELIDSFYSLRYNLDKLDAAMECVKFVKDNTYENQNSFNILKLIINTLYIISASEKDLKQIKNVFYIKLLCMLGYPPQVKQCGTCGKKEGLTGFSVKSKAVLCNECRTKGDLDISVGARLSLEYIVHSKLKDIFSFEVNEDVLKELDLIRKIYVETILNE